MKYMIVLTLSMLLAISCKQANSNAKEITTEVESTAISGLPSIPEELLQKVFLECDFVDYIFYELPFSMSYDNKNTIQSVLRWVNQSTVIPTTGCKALGRMIFQKQGNTMIEAEIYVSETCSYYKWILDGKPMYNNLMSVGGIRHYSGIINQYLNKNQ